MVRRRQQNDRIKPKQLITTLAKREASNAGMTSKQHPNPIEVFALHEEMILQMAKNYEKQAKTSKKKFALN